MPIQPEGSRLARALLRLWGWRLVFDGLPARQGVVIAYPHTSNWDFVVAVLGKWATGMPFNFLVKASLVRIPLFGRWARWVGAVPIERSSAQGSVAAMIAALREAQANGRDLWFGLTPEGTRRRTEGWRCGFYRVAMEAGVPVMLARLDWARRVVGVDSCWQPSGDLHADMALFAERLADARGRHPEQASPVRPLESPRSTP